ncbi:MAG: hypothetical protein EOO61_20425 [Hymenobacter sp.]|nr:MAG: hypothetical protein EOO61_20425 [Hymenobacter sp.]
MVALNLPRLMLLTMPCSGHGSFSNNKTLNNLVGNITHSSILVPYHGWRISHRTHHQHHGHVENDESWHPVAKHLYEKMVSALSAEGMIWYLKNYACIPTYRCGVHVRETVSMQSLCAALALNASYIAT